MSEERTCPECGVVLPSDAPRGLCPECLFAAGEGDPGERPSPDAGSAEIAYPKSQITDGFGDYELLEEIAHGGMGVVYKARQRSLDRIVAVKMIRSERLVREAEVRRFRQEAAAAAKLQHPNIVAIHEAGEVAGQHYYSMDFVEGRSLAALVGEHPLGARQAAAYVKTIAKAIHYAHSQGILHRDLKPSNVLIDAHDAPRVTDFGLAKILQSDSEVTLTGQVMGSPSYMSPEQAAGHGRDVDARTDVYALGAILYELVSGRPPFEADTSLETLKLVVESEPLPLRLLIPRLPRDLETICLKCLEKEPSRRYASAQLLADELGRFLDQEPILARPVSTAGKVWKWCRRWPALAGLGAALLLTFVLGSAGVLWQWRRATTGELLSRQNAYAADMLLAQRALVDNDLGRTLRSLQRHRPGGKSKIQNPKLKADLRNWEWRYLWRLCQPDDSIRLPLRSVPAGQVFISQNGRVMAVRTGAVKVEVWDLVSRKLQKEMQGFASTAILGLSPDGSLLAARRDEARTIEVWDVGSGRLRATPDCPSTPWSLAFSSDGRLLATFDHRSSNALVRVVDWRANRSITNFMALPPRRGQEGVVAYSPDGNRLAFEEDRGTIRVVQWPSCSIVPIPTQTTDGVTALAFSPDSKLLAAGFAYTSGTIRLWDTDSGKPRGQLTNHTWWIRALAFSPDGHWLASASQDRTIRIWSVTGQTELHRFQGHFVKTLSFMPDGRTLVSGGEDGSVCFWDVNAGGRASPPIVISISRGAGEVAAPINRFGIAFTPDSRTFITTDTNGSLAVWDAQTMQSREGLPTLGTNNWGVALSPDGRWLAVGDPAGKLVIWDWPARQRVLNLEMPFEWCGFLRFSRSGRYLWTWVWFNNHTLKAKMWRTGDWGEVPLAPLGQASIMSVDLSPDERLLATGSADGWVKLWSFPAGQLEAAFRPHNGWAFGLRFSGNGRVLASTSADGTIRLWDVLARRELEPLPGHLGGSWGLAFSPDGRRLATGGGDTMGGRARDAVKLWDLATHREVLTLPGEGQLFTDLAFSPDGNTLVATCLTGTAHFWRAPSWEEIATSEKKAKSP